MNTPTGRMKSSLLWPIAPQIELPGQKGEDAMVGKVISVFLNQTDRQVMLVQMEKGGVT